jgi:hypothetical protein
VPEIHAAPGGLNATTIGALSVSNNTASACLDVRVLPLHACRMLPRSDRSHTAVQWQVRHLSPCLAAGPALSVAQEQHVNVVKRALSDVAVYLSGARWEVQHRNAVATAQLQVMARTMFLSVAAAHPSKGREALAMGPWIC